jgi:ubiquinone/menaquinone biosynthesis C-methylase UbiE
MPGPLGARWGVDSHPMPVPEARTWDSFWRRPRPVEEVYGNDGRVARNLSDVLDPKGKRVLEVGAGTGRDSLSLASSGAEVYQLDYSMEALRLAREVASRAGAPVRLLGGNALALPFRKGSFDVVVHQGLLEHFHAPEAARLLAENVRVLKPGGYLLVDVPQRYHPYSALKHVLIAMNAWFAGWEREFSVRELERDLRDVSLVPVRAYGVWMYPSLGYRALREALRRVGVQLPLYPLRVPVLGEVRRRIREGLLRRRVALHTCFSIGVIAQKP